MDRQQTAKPINFRAKNFLSRRLTISNVNELSFFSEDFFCQPLHQKKVNDACFDLVKREQNFAKRISFSVFENLYESLLDKKKKVGTMFRYEMRNHS